MTTQEPRYLAYMLRLWQVRGNNEMVWRASLGSVQTGERRGFADLEALFAFLKQETNEQTQCEKQTRNSQLT